MINFKSILQNLKNKFKLVVKHQGIQRYAFNTSWIFIEYFLRGIAGVLVGIYVARYLAPKNFGILNYILSVTAIFAAIARVGLDGILTRELVKHPEGNDVDLGTGFWLMVIAATINLIFLLCTIALIDKNRQLVLYALLAGSSIFFQSFNVVDWFFQSRVQSKFVTFCRVIGLTVSSIIKIAAVLVGADLIVFFMIFSFDQAFLATLYVFIGKHHNLPSFLSKFSFTRAKELLKSSWPLIFTALAITLYMKIDQIMIKSMLGERDVGIYSAAVKIYEAWILVPYLLTISLLPAIVKSKKLGENIYRQRLIYLFRFIFWLSVLVTILVVMFSRLIIQYSFGTGYLEATNVLAIVMFTTAWAALGSGSARYLVVEGMEKKIAFRTIIAAVVNAILNFILLPRMGIQGAAIATLVCTFTANYALDWFDPDLKELLSIKNTAIFFLKK